MNDRLVFNGLDGETGNYLSPPMSLKEAAAIARGGPKSDADSKYVKALGERSEEEILGLPFNLDPTDIAQVGWAIVFASNVPEETRQALEPLIRHRMEQVNDDSKAKVLTYRKGEDRIEWLRRHGVGSGSLIPKRVPYYLFFVGDPDDIPFEFLHLMDVEYAVGCIHFDNAHDYRVYADSVVAYESQATFEARNFAIFAPRHPEDQCTQASFDYLAEPLANGSSLDGYEFEGVGEGANLRTDKYLGDDATKGALRTALLGEAGANTPSLLFTASHGLGSSSISTKQLRTNGTIVCQDWPGHGPVLEGARFSADDVSDKASLLGLITFHFACFSIGTPKYDKFDFLDGGRPRRLAEKEFYSALPKALLSNTNGGALACIGHIDRATGYSFISPAMSSQIVPFWNALNQILKGVPVGHAMRDFDERYASISAELLSLLKREKAGKKIPDADLVAAWTDRTDAEGFIIFGDPAVRSRDRGA